MASIENGYATVWWRGEPARHKKTLRANNDLVAVSREQREACVNSFKVLIVDDNRDLGEGLKAVLEDEDYTVTLALTGEEAISLSREQKYDFTILDVQLPGINGIDANIEIRSIHPEIQTIVMSGYRIEQIMAEALYKDKVPILYKPSTAAQILSALGSLESAGIVLIADDSPDTVGSAELFMKANNYEVLIARSKHEAIEDTQSGNIDILILDLQLPVLRGLEVYMELQKQGRVIPTVLVTGYAPEESRTDVLRSLSVTGCLFKPFTPDQLLHGLQQLRQQSQG